MCYEYDALPPDPPLAGGAADTKDLTLTSKDGTKFAAFFARADEPTTRGIVVLPDVRGLFPFYEELGVRFAEQGVSAVVFDYFGRTAGVGKRDANFDFMPEVKKTQADKIVDDVRACVEYLRAPEGGSCTSIFTIGFCFGGSNSWLQSAGGHGLAGAIGFYGRPGPSFADGSAGPVDRAGEMKAPILALMGGADPMIPAEDVSQLKSALDAAGVENEVVTYEGAPHSFFDRTYDEHKEACDDAWRRILAFIDKHSK